MKASAFLSARGEARRPPRLMILDVVETSDSVCACSYLIDQRGLDLSADSSGTSGGPELRGSTARRGGDITWCAQAARAVQTDRQPELQRKKRLAGGRRAAGSSVQYMRTGNGTCLYKAVKG